MPSTFSPNLALELLAYQEDSETWGDKTNNTFSMLEQAISGYTTQAITDGADTVITIPNGITGVARNIFLELTGALTADRNLIVPANKKLYFVYNNTSGGHSVTVKVSGQIGVIVLNLDKMLLVSNGTDIVNAITYFTGIGSFTQMSSLISMNPSTVTTNIIIPSGYNAYSSGPLTIGEDITVTLNDNSNWTIL
jgi:hypothetical protein